MKYIITKIKMSMTNEVNTSMDSNFWWSHWSLAFIDVLEESIKAECLWETNK